MLDIFTGNYFQIQRGYEKIRCPDKEMGGQLSDVLRGKQKLKKKKKKKKKTSGFSYEFRGSSDSLDTFTRNAAVRFAENSFVVVKKNQNNNVTNLCLCLFLS